MLLGPLTQRVKNIHLIGIGGSGMNGIAEILLNLGFTITGSDLRSTDVTDRLVSIGARVFIGHSPKNVENCDVVVFSIFAEEVGLLGTTILLMLMFLYVLRGFKIARQAPDMFGFLLASGLSMMIGMQIVINIGVATRLLPTTGMTLPFISYGGSSLILSFIATGILLNISKQGNYEKRLSREFGSRLHRRSVRG